MKVNVQADPGINRILFGVAKEIDTLYKVVLAFEVSAKLLQLTRITGQTVRVQNELTESCRANSGLKQGYGRLIYHST